MRGQCQDSNSCLCDSKTWFLSYSPGPRFFPSTGNSLTWGIHVLYSVKNLNQMASDFISNSKYWVTYIEMVKEMLYMLSKKQLYNKILLFPHPPLSLVWMAVRRNYTACFLKFFQSSSYRHVSYIDVCIIWTIKRFYSKYLKPWKKEANLLAHVTEMCRDRLISVTDGYSKNPWQETKEGERLP